MDLATLRAAQPDLLQQAADGWQSAAGQLKQICQELSAQTAQLFTASWAGVGADAANSSLSAQLAQLNASAADMGAMAAGYRDAALGVSGAQAVLKVAEDLAASNGLSIGPGGEVSVSLPSLPGPLRRTAEEEAASSGLPPAAGTVAGLLNKALRLAAAVDSKVSAVIARLPGPASAVAAASGLAAKLGRELMPPAGMNPQQISEWWKALDGAAQQQLIHEFPAQIGWMNGLPATARDEANRLAMTEQQASLRRELARLQAHPPAPTVFDGMKVGYVPNPGYEQWLAQINQIQNQLWGIAALGRSLARGGKGGIPKAYLLGFSLSGNGKAIIAYGDPDTAATTVTFVPGTGATLNMSGADASHAVVLWQQAHKLDPGQSLSSIYWLNYSAPQISSLSGYLNMASPAAAVAGGHALAGFQSGLAAAHAAGIPSRTVLLGHSYGTLVVGEAAAHDGVHPSDIVLVGSPGVGVDKASELGISPSHVWAGANINDPVPDIPPNTEALLPDVAGGAVVGGIGGLLTHGLSGIKAGAENGAAAPLLAAHLQNPDASYFGTNPATAPFGAHDFAADYVPGEPSSFDESYLLSFRAHTTYWTQGSASLRNMAAIVAGKYGQVTLAGSGNG